MSSSQQLPFVPSLPPLQLPSYDLTSLSVTPSDKPTSHLLQSPSLSVAESFSTAYTSTTPADDSQDLSRIPSALLVPPNSLRKSVSVDSFAHFTRDDGRPPLTDESDLSPVPAHSSFAADETEPIPAWSSRSRGLSLSSIQQSYQPVDSDVDRYEPSSLPAAERFRRQSLKSPESPQSLLRGGDLTLPSRSSSSNVPNLTEHSDLPSVASASSFQPTHKRTNPYQLPTMGRLRSGSLGYNRPPAKVVNPPISPFNRQSPTKAEIVILVIGTKGCGKSTVIKKGLSRFGLAVDWDKAPADASGTNRTRYIRRTGSMLLDQPPESPGSVPQAFDVLEVEVQRTNDGLLKWPQGLPPIDGVVICYDYSDINSYRPVEGLLKHYRGMMLPIMVLGCKTDLKHDVDPHDVVGMLAQYDTGLIEVSNTNDEGKAKMRKSFDYLIKAILRQRGPNRIVDNRNPATPSILVSDNSLHAPTNSPTLTRPNRSSTNINAPELSVLTSNLYDASLHGTPASHISSASVLTSNLYDTTLQGTPTSHISGELVNSNDIPQGNAQESDFQHPDYTPDRDSTGNSPNLNGELEQYLDQPAPPKKEPRPSQYAELEELLDKLLFLAVSGDEPTYAIHFLLTYRKFTTPRYVLLAMQKRMRQLDSPCGDPMFACFAQMRICHLLETWINSYAHDFAVKGTAGALNALIKSIISKTHLLHYGSEFLPFLEQLPSLVDEDTAWAMKADVSDTDSDDYTPEEEEEIRIGEPVEPEICSPELPSHSPQIIFPLRERKASLPLSKVRLSVSHSNGHHPTSAETHPKQYIKDLVKLAQDVMNTDSEEIAQEITRQAVGRFMIIKPRDWLNFTFVSKKLPGEPITAYNAMSNHLADWVVSLILCHDRPRQRARQIEKFVDIGVKLRNLNNYSALRAFVAGINNANDDATMELFKSKSHDHAKNLRSWDVLLQQVRAHRAYRLALRNSKGACIPAMEVHISDLIRAQEGNGDRSPIFPSKIHWGKFNMMGRFVTTTVQCQNQCRNSNDYDFPERPHIASLLNRCDVMSTEMQKSRLKSQDDYYEEPSPTPPSQPVNVTGMRRIFFW